MKNHLVKFILILLLMNSCTDSTAQQSPFAGFYDGSKMELVFHLYILPDHEFAASLIYGSVDRLIYGTWKETADNKIILEEKRKAEAPFIVYAAKGKSGQRMLNFKYFDQNTEVAMAVGEPFKAADLKYILKPDQYSFSHSYEMEVPIQHSSSLHLSRQLSDLEHEVYDFSLSDNDNEVLLMYNSQTSQPLFIANASLVNDELMMGMDGEIEQPFAIKQDLPKDTEKKISDSKKNIGIPDERKVKTNNESKLFKRIKSSKIHQVVTKISPNQSYFENEEIDNAEQVIIPTAPPIPPAKNK